MRVVEKKQQVLTMLSSLLAAIPGRLLPRLLRERIKRGHGPALRRFGNAARKND